MTKQNKLNLLSTPKDELKAYGERRLKNKIYGQQFDIVLKTLIPTYDLGMV
jgi:hypothetical protein